MQLGKGFPSITMMMMMILIIVMMIFVHSYHLPHVYGEEGAIDSFDYHPEAERITNEEAKDFQMIITNCRDRIRTN
jgi:hypothetical protein